MRTTRIASLVSAIALAGTATVMTIGQDKAAPSSGIYVEAVANQAETRLPSARFDIKESGIGKSMATMGLSKPQTHGLLPGAKASARVAGDATFRVRLNPQPAGSSQNMSPDAMMQMMSMMNGGDGSVPSFAKGPNDFALVQLSVASDTRDVNFGAAGASRPKDAIDVAVENLGPNEFRLRPKRPLGPGEYAFYVRMGNQPMGPAWDFGVDGK